ncbi:hypothetical protein PILCRDRAFT_824639 [Piloderma croceum F 1598]|uniref:Uncharacterized protein n=1 Tax=Piloderma croceum (strain F 1598) TaxID=765440 RepID=A0A0C3BLI8_PILCF|nr:hypothetical protein PILCRDRAFT_824639 [Piloderma croceum F 1598]
MGRNHTQPWAPTQRPSFALRIMNLTSNAFTDVTSWLLCLSPTPAVQTLKCHLSTFPTDLATLSTLLRSVGHSIHSLHLHCLISPQAQEGTSRSYCFIMLFTLLF